MLQVSSLKMQFGGRVLFKDVNISFSKGECYGIIGANGAGKSTTMNMISSIVRPTAGSIELFGNMELATNSRWLPYLDGSCI